MNIIKKIKYSTFIILLILMIVLPQSKAMAASTPPNLVSQGVCLLDGDTGQVVYSKNQDAKYYPASTTKILTALIVLEHCNLDDKVTIGPNPPVADGTSVGIRATETYTVRELLLGLLLMSGNDCANALSEFVSGSTTEFANLMNQKAAELGCTNSHFCNPSGLPDENHYTTPKDLATIMRACINNKDFLDIAKTPGYTLPASNIDGKTIPMDNHNYIMFNFYPRYYYSYAIASKKGYTLAAQFTNVIAAKKDNTTLVGSFLKGTDIDNTYSDVHSIFDYGFANYERQTLYSKDSEAGSFNIDDDTFSLKPAKDVYYTCNIADKNNLNVSLQYEIPSDIGSEPFSAGDKIVTADVLVNGTKVQTVDLVSGSDYTPKEETYNNSKNSKTAYIFIAIVLGLGIMGAGKVLYSKKINQNNSEEK